MKPSKEKGYVLLAVVAYQTPPRLLIITPITVILDVSSDPLAVCLQVMNRNDASYKTGALAAVVPACLKPLSVRTTGAGCQNKFLMQT